MDKFVIRQPKDLSSVNDKGKEKEISSSLKKQSVVSDDDIIADPGLRKPINSYPFEIRDALRRRYLAKGPCQPLTHKFPQTMTGNKNRRFQGSWYEKYKWLEYSIAKDKTYCLYCYLFANTNKNGSNAFTQVGFSNWKDGLKSFVDHEGSNESSHAYCRIKVQQYLNQRENVDYVLSTNTVAIEDNYRTRLATVVKVARYLLGEGLAFRGHDESPDSIHRGNFLELISWFCKTNEAADKVMQMNAPKNNQMTSPTIQRDIIESCAMETRNVILNELGKKNFALLVDEARDCSVKEQMSLIVRFVNDKGEIIERFLGLVHVEEISAKFLKMAIDEFFAKHGLSLSRLRGQGYDGASNMRGQFNGLKSLILNENKNAYYVHCFAHQLQLVIVAAAQDRESIFDFFEKLLLIVNTVGSSCKRKDFLLQVHEEETLHRIETGELSTGRGQNQATCLARPGETRWGSHYKTLVRLFDMWNAIGTVLNSLHKHGETTKIQNIAGDIIDKMDSFEFVFIGKFMLKVLGMINTLSKMLQARDQNISCALNMIGVVKKNFQDFRNNGWDDFLKDVSDFCEEHDIDVPNMEDFLRGRSRKKMKGGEPMTNYVHFRGEIFAKVIDILAMEMDRHFTETNTNLLRCVMCLDPSNCFASFDQDRLLELAMLYSEDFSSSDRIELVHELQNYICDMRSNEVFTNISNLGSLAKKMVEMNYHTYFPLVYRLIELALILPVGTASVERSFSAMNIVKTDLRNRLGDEMLSDCLLCYFEKEIFMSIDDEVIMQRFQKLASRKNFLRPQKKNALRCTNKRVTLGSATANRQRSPLKNTQHTYSQAHFSCNENLSLHFLRLSHKTADYIPVHELQAAPHYR